MINWYSRQAFLLLFIVAGVVSNTAEFIMVDEKFGGISGVNFALFGFIFMFHLIKPNGSLFINREFSIMVFAFLILSATDWIGDYSFVSHVSGLLVGMMMGYLLVKKEPDASD